jgi:hypothetical protein
MPNRLTIVDSETCFFCGEPGVVAHNLTVWYIETERRTIHTECWIAAFRSGGVGAETLT